MSIRAITFNKMMCKSEDDALIFDTFLNHINGRIKGCNLTYDTNNIFISVGYFMAQGRLLNVFGAHTVNIPAVEIGDQYVQVVYEIDLSKTNTATDFQQGGFKLLTSFATWQSYTQEDLFNGGYVYQIPFCRMRNSVDGIHSYESLLDTVVVSEIWDQLVIENQQYRAQFQEFFDKEKVVILKMIQELQEQDFISTTVFTSAMETLYQNSLNSRVSNCILEMPTKPTYSGLIVTVYAGTKVVIPNGRNEDGTLKNIIYTITSNTNYTITYTNASVTCYLFADGTVGAVPASNWIFIDRLSSRPTTVAGTGVYKCYCEETNLWYSTIGSTTANWSSEYQTFAIIGTAVVGASAITSLAPRDTLKLAQQEDFVAFKKNFQAGCSTIASAITANGVSTASNASPTTMATNMGNIRSGGNLDSAGNQLLAGYTAYSGKVLRSGAMPNRGAWGAGLNATTTSSVAIPYGFHNGTGVVYASPGMEVIHIGSTGGTISFSKKYKYVFFSIGAKRDISDWSHSLSVSGNYGLPLNKTATDGDDFYVVSVYMWDVVPGHYISYALNTLDRWGGAICYGIT